MIQKLNRKGYSLEPNPIEQFWAVIKSHPLITEEKNCKKVFITDNYGFYVYSKRQIIDCYNKTPFKMHTERQ